MKEIKLVFQQSDMDIFLSFFPIKIFHTFFIFLLQHLTFH